MARNIEKYQVLPLSLFTRNIHGRTMISYLFALLRSRKPDN